MSKRRHQLPNNTASKKLNYTLESLRYNDLIEDFEFKNSLKIIENRLSKNESKHNTDARITQQINSDLIIISDYVNRLETSDGIITWTFETENPLIENSDFENFVVKKVDTTFSYYLVTYQYDSSLLENAYTSIESYRVMEEYLSLDSLNFSQRIGNDFDWIYPDDGGGTYEDCVDIYTELEPCSSGGYHTKKYACQHYGGPHGVSDTPPCDNVCSGTQLVTVIDYSGCEQGTYNPPSGPTNGTTDNQTGNDIIAPTGGGSNTSNDTSNNSTLTAPISNSDGTTIDPSTIDDNQIDPNITSLDNQVNNTKIKSKIEALQAIVNSSLSEDGMQFDLIANSDPIDFNEVTPIAEQSGTNHIKFPDVRPNTLVNLHLHPKYGLIEGIGTPQELSPIFSDGDVYFMLEFFEDTNNNEDISSLIVSAEGVFALRVTDAARATFMKNKLDIKRFWKRFLDNYIEDVLTSEDGQPPYTNQQIIDNFIIFLNTYQINNSDAGQGFGLSLYQATLDTNGNITGWIKP
ncbi:hypothetical protein [Olleya aquimaris]|nr:hypothetical protein [Olleya aquimaris]